MNSLGYEKQVSTVELTPNEKIYSVSFLLKVKVEELNVVVLKPYEKISSSGNVTTIQVNPFNDGSEQTVEDILKNLPGIEVLNDGSIKAHGKFIDKLLIEGEDLFNSNYKILSKNLDAKVIDAIEILDSFEDNPILAKVIDSEKVALNLVLKEEYKNIWFGNLSMGLGSSERVATSLNLGLIRKKIKFFYFGDYNNLGERAFEQIEGNTSSININTFSREERIEPNISPVYSIQNNENNILQNGQSTFNKALINSLSFVTNLNSKIKLRGTGYFTNDIQNQFFSSETVFNTGENPVRYSESNNTIAEKSIFGGELELKYDKGENVYIKNFMIYRSTPTKSSSELLFNENDINQNLRERNHSFYNHFNHSFLFEDDNVINTYLYFGKNKINQKAHINSPVLNNLFSLSENESINNSSDDDVNVYGGKSMLISTFQKFQNTIEVGYESLKETRNNKFIISDLGNGTAIDSLQNKIEYIRRKFQIKTQLNYSFSEKVELSAGFSLDYLNISTGVSETKKWLFNPKVILKLKKMKIGRFHFSYIKNYDNPESILFLENYQLQNYQSFIRGTDTIYLPNNNQFGFNYQWNNEMKTKNISLRARYRFSDGKYSTENDIGQDLIFSSYRFVDSGNFVSSNINYTSYFKKLNISTNLGTSQNWSIIPVRANTANFQDLKLYTSLYSFAGTTYFKSPVNFTFKLNLNNSKSNFNNIIVKTNWENLAIDINYKISDSWIASLNNEIYWVENSNYYFTGFNLNYTPKESKFSFQLVLNNLMNERTYSTINIDDFSTYRSDIQLLPRYALVSAKYRF